MNAILKIRNMGFKKTEFMKVESNWNGTSVMIPDNVDTKVTIIDGKRKTEVLKKVHPKYNSFHVMEYLNIKIWVLVKRNNIHSIWLEKENKVESIYNILNGKILPINSKRDIINLLPKNIQRDFLLKELLT